MATTEFDDSQHYGIFTTSATLTSQTGKMVRQSELVLAALRSQGVFDNLVDSTTAPAHDKLWLDKNSDPAVLKEWDSVGSNWTEMTFNRLFGRAIVTDLTNVGGTANAITVDEPANFIDNRLYSITPAANNTGAATITVTGVGTYDVKYHDGDDIDANEFIDGQSTVLLFTGGRFEVLYPFAAIHAAQVSAAASAAAAAASAASIDIGTGSDLSTDPDKLAKRGDVLANVTAATKADASALTPSTAPDFIRTAGYTSAGDGGGALYKKIASEPSHDGKFSITLSDGTTTVWFELAEMLPTPEMFGAPKDGTNDDAPAINSAFAYAQALKRPQVMLSGEYRLNTTIIPKSGVMLRGTSGAARLNSHTSVAYEVSTANAPLQHGGISGVAFINSDDTDVNAIAIKLDACQHCVFEHVYAEGYDAGTVVRIQPQILQANLPAGLDGLASEGMNFIFNKFDQFLVTKCKLGFIIGGGASAGPITNVVTANEYHGITLRSVTDKGIASLWWHDNDRFYDWHINITADNAACVVLGVGASGSENVGVSAHHFYGLTMVRDPGVSWTACYGLALTNTPGCLVTVGSDLNWPVPGLFIYNPYNVEVDVRGSYLHPTFADDDYGDTTPADENRLGHISQSTLTEQFGNITVPAGEIGVAVDMPFKMFKAPDVVNVMAYTNPGVYYWVDYTTVGAAAFAIKFSAALPNDTQFNWEAKVRKLS